MPAPSCTLFYNMASPFARKVLIFLHETGQFDRVTLQQTLPTPVSPDAALCDEKPGGQAAGVALGGRQCD